jgi:hypothetical protein
VNVLIACERSGVVRRAFRDLGHNAWSCDLEPADDGDPHHLQMDAIEAAYGRGPYPSGWDLMIAHPECTFLANSGAKHLYAGMKKENGPDGDRWARMGAAAQFYLTLRRAPIPRKVLENPIMLGHPRRLFGLPRHKQIIQPWMFGDFETKATGLDLIGVDPLRPTYATWQECRDALGLPADAKPVERVFKMAPGPNRKKDRSETYPGIAHALAMQLTEQSYQERLAA